MKCYVVIFEDSAQTDVRESYDCCCRAWGKRDAQQWARELRTEVFKQLDVIPKALLSIWKITVAKSGCLVRSPCATSRCSHIRRAPN